jgi:hypothetical protein
MRSESSFAEMCQQLQENRQDVADASFGNSDRGPFLSERAIRMGRALRGNTELASLSVHVPVRDMSLANTEGIANFIAVSPSLKDLRLIMCVPRHHVGAGEEASNAPILDRFLLAAALNGQLRKLLIYNVLGALPLANCLHANRTTLKTLNLSFRGDANGVVVTPEMNASANLLAGAFGTLTSLEEIYIRDQNDLRFVVRILSGLVNHPSLRELDVEGSDGEIRDINEERRANAIKDILLSSTPLESLSFHARSNDSYESAKLIFTCLHGQRSSLSTLWLDDDSPESDEGATVFADMLRHNTTVETLVVNLYSFVGFSTIVEALVTNSESSLQRLYLTFFEMDDEALLKEGCRRLATLLPRLRHLKTLSVDAGEYCFGNIPADFLRGLELNKSLTSVSIDDLEDHDVIAAIDFYPLRNELAPRLASASKEQMLSVFESALEYDEQAGLSVVFDALRVRDDWYGHESTGDNKAENLKRQKLHK